MYELNQEEIDAVTTVLRSRKLFRYQGKSELSECQHFEQEFASYLGASHALMVSSGTNALLNALRTLGIGAGDEVLIPCFTFVATAAAVLQVGATPVLVNIDDSLTMDPADAKKKITPRTRAILPVHMDGLPCAMDKLSSLAREQGLFLLEDVAQAPGGSFQGKKLGTFGDAGCFSFNVDKIISCGEGGAVVFSEEERFKKALLNHDPAVSYGLTHREYLQDFTPVPGNSMRVSEISGALMRVQLRRLDEILERLRRNKRILREALSPAEIDYVSALDPEGDCGTSLHLRLPDPLRMSQISKNLFTQGITCYPTGARPAHTYGQWLNLLRLDESATRSLQTDLAPSKILLSTSLKIQVQPDWTEGETAEKALRIIQAVK